MKTSPNCSQRNQMTRGKISSVETVPILYHLMRDTHTIRTSVSNFLSLICAVDAFVGNCGNLVHEVRLYEARFCLLQNCVG